MREVRVNPAALRGTAAKLAEVKAPPAPTAATPASSHPVSAAAAAQINANQANITQLMTYAGLLAQRAAATYEQVAARYDAVDTEGRHRIAKAQAEYFTAMGRPTPAPPEPAAAAPAPPVPPHPPEPICLPHPPDPIAAPQVVDAAASQLSTGDNGASLRALATTWRAHATTIDGYHTAITEAANTTSEQWSGDAATSAVSRLRPFADWFKDAASSCRDAAGHAERVATAHAQAVSDHPTPQYLQEIRNNYSNAVARNNAAEAEKYRQALIDAQTKSTQVVASYAQSAAVPMAVVPPVPSPVNPNPAPPKTKPKPSVEKPKHGPGDPEKKTEPEGTGGSPRPDSAGAGSDDTVAKKIDGAATAESPETIPPPPDDLSGPEVDAAALDDQQLDDQQLQPTAAPPLMPLIQGLTQGLGQAAQGGQGQGMPQMPQMPQMMPTMPQTPTPPMTPPMTPPTDAPIEPASFDPMSGSGSGGGGGGGGGGGPAPAATSPGLPATAVPLNSTPAGPSAGSPPSASAIGAGMPMGMMPPGGGRGGESDKNREGDLNPDEAIYVEDRPNTSAFIGGRIGPEPPPEAKED